MANRNTGSCACGAVRYEFSGEPMIAGHCHCRDCQRATGTGHSPAMVISKSQFKVTGSVKTYQRKADSGSAVSSAFCPECGSPLYCMTSGMPDAVLLRVGNLDDPSRFKPRMAIYTDSGHSWDVIDPALPKFPKSPPMK
jgi:hypothetical protein